jgi:hypothetical protein
VRVDKGGGVPGMMMGDWLVNMGLETAKPSVTRPKTSLDALRRRQGVHREAAASRATGQMHRSGLQSDSLISQPVGCRFPRVWPACCCTLS